MKKRVLSLVLAAAMVLSLAGCGSTTTESAAPAADNTAATEEAAPVAEPAADTASESNTTDIAFVTDVGNIDDQSFNQYTWAGVQEFASANGLVANYYKPSEDSDAGRVEQMDNAIKDGAKVVVMAGYLFAGALAEAQDKYPDVSFLAIDVSTGDLANPASNTALVTYKEEQAGYLAGYAAVTDGYKELGFLGGMAVPAVVRYGYGFVQGAEQAAKDNSVDGVNIKYWYSGSFVATDDIKAKMDSWYSEGTEVVFACGGSICNSCLAAAQANNGKMIGVDVDQSNLDPNVVITSAMKALANSVKVTLADALANDWKFSSAYAGKETTLGAAEDCVGLPMATSNFSTFSQEKYDELFASLADGSLVVDNSFDTAVTPAVSAISVDYQE